MVASESLWLPGAASDPPSCTGGRTGNLPRMPRWALLFLGAVIAALLAIYLSPVFPPPLSMILYWVFWVIAAIAAIMGVLNLLGMARGRGSRV